MALAAHLVTASGLSAQELQRRAQLATLVGFVLQDDSSEAPVVTAEIVAPELRLRTRTNVSGHYVLSGIPPGVHRIVVRALGFSAIDVQLAFLRPDTLERDFLIATVNAKALPEVTVTARRFRSEFEERRALGKGHFLDRAHFERARDRPMADALSQVPGLRVKRGHVGRAWVASSRGRISILREYTPEKFERDQGARAACYSHVYLDGALMFGGGKGGLFDINSLSPSNIEAVEYYAGGAQTPAKFNMTGSACGVLVIWTRSGPPS